MQVLFDVLAAVYRKHISLLNSGPAAAGDVFSRPGRVTPPANTANARAGLIFSGENSVWKEEVVAQLREVQAATLEVVRRVQLWRRNLWRPLPFVWNDCDYLVKVSRDLLVLEEAPFALLLASVPLARDELPCLLFQSLEAAVEGAAAEKGGASNGSPLLNTLPAHHKAVLLKAPPPIRLGFFAGIDQGDLAAADAVVKEQPLLVAALQVEQNSLKANKVRLACSMRRSGREKALIGSLRVITS